MLSILVINQFLSDTSFITSNMMDSFEVFVLILKQLNSSPIEKSAMLSSLRQTRINFNKSYLLLVSPIEK